MENTVINTKTKIMSVAKRYLKNLDLHSDKITERDLKLKKKCIKSNKDLVNDKGENDIEYITYNLNNIESVFKGFCLKYNIDHTPEEPIINNPTLIETPEWIKNKKFTINPQNKDNKCFQYSIIVSLYNKEIKNNPERISKIKPFINNLNFPPQEPDHKTFEMNNK